MPATSLFNRYRPIGSNPDATMLSPDDFPGTALPPAYDDSQYQSDLSGIPLADTAPTDSPQQYDTGSGDSASSQTQVPSAPALPSMRQNAMDSTKTVPFPQNADYSQPQGAPPPTSGVQGAVPTPPVDPNSPQGLLNRYAALKAPVAGKQNIFEKIGQAALSATRMGPEGAAAIMHPNYGRQVGQYNAQKADLTNQINLADKVANIQSLNETREGNAATRAEKAEADALSKGYEFYPNGAPAPPGLLPMPMPKELEKARAGQTAYFDPHHGQFQVTQQQSELSNGALRAGDWIPLTQLSELVKSGVARGAPVKTNVEVSAATARAHQVMTPPNARGNVEVPITLANEWPETGKQEKPVTEKNLNPADILLHPGDFTPEQVTTAQKMFNQEHREPRAPSDTAGINALDRETARFAKPYETMFRDSNTQLDKINDAQQMVRGGAIDQALGIPKVMTALITGPGSGVRITQAELQAIANARGLAGDVEGTIRSWLGKGKLIPAQQQQLDSILQGVQQRVLQKRQIANDAQNEINSAASREEALKATQKYNQMIMDMDSARDLQQRRQQQGGGGRGGQTQPAPRKSLLDRYGLKPPGQN
jgi:hypothetical protein